MNRQTDDSSLVRVTVSSFRPSARARASAKEPQTVIMSINTNEHKFQTILSYSHKSVAMMMGFRSNHHNPHHRHYLPTHYFVVSLFLQIILLLHPTLELTRTSSSRTTTYAATATDLAVISTYFGGSGKNEVYVSWHNRSKLEERYENSIFLPSEENESENGVAIHWSVLADDDDETNNDNNNKQKNGYLNIAIAARATGWIGFGIAEAGGMLGTDMVLFTAIRPTELRDAYTLEDRQPLLDDCSQDWELTGFNIDDTNQGYLMFEARRRWDTGDPQDHKIINDTLAGFVSAHRVVAAWGDTPEVSSHGPDHRVRGAIRFFGEGVQDEMSNFHIQMAKSAEGTFEIRASNFTIPPYDTKYQSFCIDRDDMLAQGIPSEVLEDGLNLVGYEALVSNSSTPYVHHFMLYAAMSDDCDNGDLDLGLPAEELMFNWGPGVLPLSLPSNVGSPFYGTDGNRRLILEIHYNNPHREEGVVDNSGVRLYYTTQPREYQLGVLFLGDPNISLEHQPTGEGLHKHRFHCPSSCSSSLMKEGPVTVIREGLHMHHTGVRMMNEQLRDKVIVHTSLVDVFEFDQSGAYVPVQEPYTIEPGDGFKTYCYYRGTSETEFGLSSNDEMCIAYLYHYPRIQLQYQGLSFPWSCSANYPLEDCNSLHTSFPLENNAALGRVFGSVVVGEEFCNDESEDGPTAAPIMEPLQPTTTILPLSDDDDDGDDSPMTSSTASVPILHVPLNGFWLAFVTWITVCFDFSIEF